MNRREALKRTALITGIAISSSVSMALLNGCKPSGKESWQAQFLDEEEVKLVTAICDIILPATDSPGALEIHVPEFIDLMLKECWLTDDGVFKDSLSSFSALVKKERRRQIKKNRRNKYQKM